MDVGYYLGELLMLQGEVSVPGLGYFVQARMSGYYDENEGKFYPPYHVAQFDPQSIDDDALAEYIANKKNISITSAKYFSEKYITSLKQNALIDEVQIGNLGWFYTEHTQLTFKPASKIIDDTIFYGYEPVKLTKAGQYVPEPEPVKVELKFPPRFSEPQPITREQPIEEKPIEDLPTVPEQEADAIAHEQELLPEYFEEYEEEAKNPLRVLLIVLTVLIILGVGVFALYRYKPETFNKLQFWKHTTIAPVAVKPKVIIKPKVDTVKKDSLKTDTAAKIVAIDTTKDYFEVIAGKFKDTVAANSAIKKLKAKGVDAKIVTDVPGPLKKISLGTYQTRDEAEEAIRKLEDAGKVKVTETYSQKIKPKK